jgi:hypothetical protein
MTSPRDEITRRLEARRAEVSRLDAADARVARLRLAVFLALAAVAWLAFGPGAIGAGWLAIPGAAFVALMVRHDRVLRARARARRAVAFHEAALARLDGRFAGLGTPGDRFLDPEHPYAADLDLFGAGSLFELLCAARTYPGEERLAAWLLSPSPPAEVRARQRAVAELAPRLDLREDLAVLGEDVRAGVDAPSLAAWGESPPLLPRWARGVGLALAAAALGGLGLWIAGLGPVPLVVVLLVAWAAGRLTRAAVARTLGGVERPAEELKVLALLLARLEAERVEDPRLEELLLELRGGDGAASDAVRRLVAVAARAEWVANQFFAPIGFALQWTLLHAAAVERWRARHGRRLRGWLDALAELEALSSLAGHAYEHPDDAVPVVLDRAPGEPAVLSGDALGHPLLPRAVPNPVRLGGGAGPAALLVSGSNMSGKSTYLRTVGVNVVLALAGARVRAARLELTTLQPGATLRIQDSLQAGRSRFYAEITRLKALADLAARGVPLLFLLDEILHGTNSHDRRIGAEAVVRGLLARGAIGLVTTHDLALTELAGSEGALANAHFEDQVADGGIAFDYRLRPGVVTHSNALALMRAVGLPV